jgi:hypothetical protein
MEIGDIDLFELTEAFSSVVLRFMQAFGVDHGRLNVNGGAIAMGHPLGATGAMILGTLLDEMERSDRATGLATLCVASGMGAATILERVCRPRDWRAAPMPPATCRFPERRDGGPIRMAEFDRVTYLQIGAWFGHELHRLPPPRR